MAQSLFGACKKLYRAKVSGTYTIGEKEVFLELYGQEDITNKNPIGSNTNQNYTTVIIDDTITIPSGYTLTPQNPRKSLVILCNNFVNNGTISMTAKAPNVTPHDWYIIGRNDGFSQNIVIPALAENSASGYLQNLESEVSGAVNKLGNNGTNGTSRNCGSGGVGTVFQRDCTADAGSSGSGYAFGGGAGSGGVWAYLNDTNSANVSTSTPMIPTNGVSANDSTDDGSYYAASGKGYGNGGCGGRIIIFCNSFSNNGTISTNGTATVASPNASNSSIGQPGGASGAGAVDVFYTELVKNGTINANGGTGTSYDGVSCAAGGNGSITLTQWSLVKIVKPLEKYMSRANMIYFLNGLVNKIQMDDI